MLELSPKFFKLSLMASFLRRFLKYEEYSRRSPFCSNHMRLFKCTKAVPQFVIRLGKINVRNK